MGRNWNEKETDRERINRWLNTDRDAFGKFTGVPNVKNIQMHLKYYGEENRDRKKRAGL